MLVVIVRRARQWLESVKEQVPAAVSRTVYFVNEIPDGGEIVLQKAVEIAPSDTPEPLQKRVMEQAEWILLPRATEMTAKAIIEAE